MFLDWKTQYKANGHMIQNKLQIQYSLTTNSISIKLPWYFSQNQNNNNQKKHTICIETQNTSDRQSNLEKKIEDGEIILPDFRLYCKATSLIQYGIGTKKKKKQKQKYRGMEQGGKSEINSCTCGHLIFDKGCKNIQ